MTDFVGTPPFLRIALWVAMVTMHFHIAQTCFIFRNIFCALRGPGNNLSPTRNCPMVQSMYVKLDAGVFINVYY